MIIPFTLHVGRCRDLMTYSGHFFFLFFFEKMLFQRMFNGLAEAWYMAVEAGGYDLCAHL